MDTLLKLIGLLQKYYFQVHGLAIGYVCVAWIATTTNAWIKAAIPTLPLRLFCHSLLVIAWTLVWWKSRTYFPRTKKGKIGLVIAINAENEKQKTRVKSDFAERLTSALEQNNLSSLFQTTVLSDYRASRATQILRGYARVRSIATSDSPPPENARILANWQGFQKRVRGHFYVWGTIKERMNIENTYLMNLDGLVTHHPLDLEVRGKIQREFLSIFPRQISFYERFEMNGFQVTADYMYLAVRYVTGIAAFFSGDPVTALKLHGHLKEEIERFAEPLPPNLRHVLDELQQTLRVETALLAKHRYFIENDVTSARVLLGQIIGEQYDALILSAYIAFKDDSNPLESLKLLHRAKRVSRNDFTWLYNKAFLLMYLEKFKLGLKDYKKLANLEFDGENDIVDQCIDFNQGLVGAEPEKIQSLFIIAFLLFRKKLNFPMALEYFEKFRSQASGRSQYSYLLDVSSTYIHEINSQMRLTHTQ